MNCAPLRSAVFPANSPKWDIVVASVFLIATTAGLISAKTMAFSGAIFIALLTITYAVRGNLSIALFKQSSATLPVTGFLLLTAASIFWVPDPMAVLPSIMSVTCLGFSVLLAIRMLAAGTPSDAARLAESLWIGLLIGLVYLLLRNATQGAADRLFLPNIASTVLTIGAGEITRSTAPASLLIGPALLALAAGINAPWRGIFSAMIVIAAILAVAVSPHETSKLALVAGAVVFAIAYVSDRWAYRLLQVGWVSICLLIVPLAIFAKSQDLQNAKWLQRTAQQRILIWNEFAQKTLDAPLLGHGFDVAAVTKPIIPGFAELPYLQSGKKVPAKLVPYLAIHPHNVYLQVWFEFGAVGAALMLAAGLATLAGLARLSPHQRPSLYATAGAAAVMIFSSYGLWQIWFVGMLAFSAIACAIAIKVSSTPIAAEANPTEA